MRGDRAHATLFHLVAYASIRLLHTRPGLNRFVSGGSIYQRTGVWLSFAAKTRFTDEAPLTTVKLGFSEKERFDECVDRMDDAVKDGRCGRESPIEREVRLLTKLPGLPSPNSQQSKNDLFAFIGGECDTLDHQRTEVGIYFSLASLTKYPFPRRVLRSTSATHLTFT